MARAVTAINARSELMMKEINGYKPAKRDRDDNNPVGEFHGHPKQNIT